MFCAAVKAVKQEHLDTLAEIIIRDTAMIATDQFGILSYKVMITRLKDSKNEKLKEQLIFKIEAQFDELVKD